ncbi:MAG: hypothetical protein FJ404_15385 [Verrucomicrobia bacterium]|nr:hypothetical protein [Verrucomicrobiota bacterium]
MFHRVPALPIGLLLTLSALCLFLEDVSAASSRARRILYNLDGDSCMTLKAGRSGPGPITTTDLTNLVAELTLPGSQLDTLLVCVNAQVMYYPTKVGTLRGTLSMPEERAKWSAHEQQRFENMQAFFNAGVDPYAVILSEARRRGLEALLTFRMNDAHGNDFLRTAFWRDHPQFRLGNGALDFGSETVRDYVFRLIEEAVQRYDCDGLELDFQRFPTFFKTGTPEENTAKINSFVERVRQLLNAEGAKRGRQLVLSARVPSDYGQTRPTYQQARSQTKSCDPAEWARRGWIDFLTVSEFLFTTETLDLKSWRRHVKSIPIYGAIQPETKPSRNEGRCEFCLGPEGYPKFARERWADGADGIYLFNFFTSREWREPIEPPFEVLAQIGDPKTLALATDAQTRRVAGLTTVYRHNSHADVILSRLLLTDTLDGKGKNSPLQLVSLYTDQRPPNDTSRLLAASHRFPIYTNIADALTLDTGNLAVDGVLLIAEHGDYPRSPTGNTQYPKRRFWDEILKVFRASRRVVPVFIDKHLADNWTDAKYIYDTAKELNIPLLAGSSVPGSWRHPAADVERGAALEEIVMITFGSTDHYGFHGLECLQSVVEQRGGGETGVRAVQCLAGNAVWVARDAKQFDSELLDMALSRQSNRRATRQSLSDLVKEPILWRIEYRDGLKATVLELNGAVNEWTGAWRYQKDRRIESTQFWTQEGRPAAHFTLLLNTIESMILTGRPLQRVERTLMTSGLLDALLQSQLEGQTRKETPYLEFGYQPIWRWQQPAPPPLSRPWSEQ